MHPQMRAEPGSSHCPDRRRNPVVLRRAVSVKISIVMCHKATTAVHPARNTPSVLPHPPDQIKECRVAFRQCADLCRPVVHFRIDVDRIFAVPRRHEILVPDTLQRRRKIPRAAAPDQQIPSVVKQQLCKPFVRTAAYDPLQTLVGRKRGIFLFFRQG